MNACSIRGVVLRGKQSEDTIADKKKADYQEGLEKSCADTVALSHDSYMKTQRKVVHKVAKVA